jgi:hypothetical protein
MVEHFSGRNANAEKYILAGCLTVKLTMINRITQTVLYRAVYYVDCIPAHGLPPLYCILFFHTLKMVALEAVAFGNAHALHIIMMIQSL